MFFRATRFEKKLNSLNMAKAKKGGRKKPATKSAKKKSGKKKSAKKGGKKKK